MKQAQALTLLKSGRNVFLTGSAGAGKTYVLNQYIQYLRDRKVKVAVTASTGIAATHMNGMTIHAWSGIGIKDKLTSSDLSNLKKKKYLSDKMEKVQVLIIDEISMLHKTQLELVNKVLKFFKETDAAFGGMQVIFSGDFFQLPPVGRAGETTRDKFAFMSKAWLEAKLAICYLTEQHRQSGNELDVILNEIRAGSVSQKSLNYLEEAKYTELVSLSEPPKLFSHNADVSRINTQKLAQLKTPHKVFVAITKGNAKLLETLKKSVRASQKLTLKVGAKVMFVKNNYDEGYINGTLGEVVGYERADVLNDEEAITNMELPIVKLLHGRRLTVQPTEWSIDNDAGSPLASFNQIPLRLAWAITVHKSQGMTLEAAEVDLSKSFERGQGYVALSRLKSITGLKLAGFNNTALEVDPLAFKADKRFQELSKEEELSMIPQQLRDQALNHIINCGGTNNLREIERVKKQATEKKSKKSTYVITREMIEEGKTLKQVAQERSLTLSTIQNHIAKISELYPHVNLNRFKPPDYVLHRVRKSYYKILEKKEEGHIKEDGTVSQKAMYNDMRKEFTYSEIKLALTFIKD